ncbi:DNA recombination protein RmuC [Solicola sp. PLA-1-18]|uniref:DNA recombination protein RmuC n=1 Tax=Solicola sp. PLA-1-18 TaxID=3380532 RepID=UPI003B7D0DFD
MDVLPLLLVALLALAAGLAIGAILGARLLRAPSGDAGLFADQMSLSATATSQAVAPVRESLDRFDARLRQLESSRIEWHAQLREQVEAVRATGEGLRRETASLATALRRPQVRGRWGEMHLRRAVELAGLVDRCDFTEQATLEGDDGALLRPDMVVHLAGDRKVVVDSKVPLDAFLDAGEATSEAERAAQLTRHARQLRTHVDQLAAKGYWRRLDHTPEFVVLFVPGESFLSAALEADGALLEHAAAQKVVLATPTTLIALLRTVAHAWTQARLADNAREIHRLARDLYERLGTAGTHLDKVGRSLGSAVSSYNSAVASIESRVMVSARRLAELDVSDEPLAPIAPVERTVRPLTAPELADVLPPTLSDEVTEADASGPASAARRAV